MEQQFVRIRDILDIEQFDFRIDIWIEVFIHILQHVFDTNLFAVAYRPHAIELQALDHGTLQDEDSRSTRAADEIDT